MTVSVKLSSAGGVQELIFLRHLSHILSLSYRDVLVVIITLLDVETEQYSYSTEVSHVVPLARPDYYSLHKSTFGFNQQVIEK